MPERLYANINPELLRWGRETAGFDLEEAARKIGISPERLEAFESGVLPPTVRQLREAARVYKRPLAVFFLGRPPATPEPLHDFRRLPNRSLEQPSPDLLLEIRRARRRRTLALQLLGELGQEPTLFSLETTLDEDVEIVARRARAWLGVSLQQQQVWRAAYDALNGWLSALESRSILVFQTGDVALEEMRGFSISSQTLPTIVLNGHDFPRARIFTLMHEFSHVMLMRGGVCDPLYINLSGRTTDEQVEIFCNRVAGAILIPMDALMNLPIVQARRTPTTWVEGEIRDLASQFGVSREVALFRLLAIGRVSQRFVSIKLHEYRDEYASREEEEQLGFPPVYRMAVRDNGRLFTRLVLGALERGHITLADVSDYLGVRLKHLDRIADAVQMALPGP